MGQKNLVKTIFTRQNSRENTIFLRNQQQSSLQNSRFFIWGVFFREVLLAQKESKQWNLFVSILTERGRHYRWRKRTPPSMNRVWNKFVLVFKVFLHKFSFSSDRPPRIPSSKTQVSRNQFEETKISFTCVNLRNFILKLDEWWKWISSSSPSSFLPLSSSGRTLNLAQQFVIENCSSPFLNMMMIWKHTI